MNDNTALQVRDLRVQIETDTATLDILHGISFDIYKGETLGIVGESGCGKSMTALSIMRLTQSNAKVSGSIVLDGQSLLDMPMKDFRRIRGNRVSMIFQEPMTSLNPVFTVGHQLMEVFRLHQGLDKKQAREKSIEALRMVNVPMPEKRVDCYPYELSGGLRQRVMIAMALACRPELLIADEPTTALDVTIQAQVLDLMCKLRDELGTAIAFITHDLGVVSELCSRTIVLYCGEIMEEGDTESLLTSPLHPYTEGLKASLPERGTRERLHVIPGSVPSALDFPKGCVFAPRCPYATARCAAEKPPLYDMGGGRSVRCFRCEEVSK
ncbi:MAG TPA: ABC transporter ATP-binding protein [Candidatus Oscillibacter excrementigallinarum]|uniref:ABC transporter ATP-binding protein n=1 Tax=Candidatus Oscillibacter excrementigallinarum TaxID=2838716 RepID=A0A9D2LGC7_9FIRM|nr:ABC transporter ATP-binding protein [Candidatus Oscillibacter excrementigallinarum]